MNTKELTYLLQNPSFIKEEQTQALEKIILEFPYFQSLRSIQLKGLKDQGSFKYNQELKTTAAYTLDRGVLFEYITSILFKEKTSQSSPEKKDNNDITVVDAEEIKALARISMNDAVAMKINEAEDVLDPKLFTSKNEQAFRHITIAESLVEQSEKNETSAKVELEKPEEKLAVDEPFNFSKEETHSFAEWLQLTSIQPIDRTEEKDITENSNINEENDGRVPPDKQHKFDLIDSFISNNPKIQPIDKHTSLRNLAKEHNVAPDELMTETLARVYVSQKKYEKAIQAYKILILKNPEKSGFFADQIRTIEKIQENK